MNKIIAAVDAANFSATQLESLLFITRQAKGKLTIVSLEDIINQQFPEPNLYNFQYAQVIQERIQDQRRLHQEHLTQLYHICEEQSDDIQIYETSGLPVAKLISESRFADLLLINNATSFAFLFETNPPRFVKDVLINAQCPVMVLPEKLTAVEDLIFTCNSSFSSMYAIRQFTQLFPGMSDVPATLVYVREANKYALPKENLVMDYLDHHYDEVKLTVLDGEAPTALLDFLSKYKYGVATYGAYGRSSLSRFFHHSDAERTLRSLNMPLFITHP